MSEYKEVKLSDVCGGLAEQLFQIELKKILENLRDLNTEPKKVREINIKLKFITNSERNNIAMNISAASKLASIKDHSTMLYLNRKGQVLEHNPGDQLLPLVGDLLNNVCGTKGAKND